MKSARQTNANDQLGFLMTDSPLGSFLFSCGSFYHEAGRAAKRRESLTYFVPLKTMVEAANHRSRMLDDLLGTQVLLRMDGLWLYFRKPQWQRIIQQEISTMAKKKAAKVAKKKVAKKKATKKKAKKKATKVVKVAKKKAMKKKATKAKKPTKRAKAAKK
jgi:hypothetical protein